MGFGQDRRQSGQQTTGGGGGGATPAPRSGRDELREQLRGTASYEEGAAMVSPEARAIVLSAVGSGPYRMQPDGTMIIEPLHLTMPEPSAGGHGRPSVLGHPVSGHAPVTAHGARGEHGSGHLELELEGQRLVLRGHAPVGRDGHVGAEASVAAREGMGQGDLAPEGELEVRFDRSCLEGELRLMLGEHGVEGVELSAEGRAGDTTVAAGVELELGEHHLEAVAAHFRLAGPEEARSLLLRYKRAWHDHHVEDAFEATFVARMQGVSVELHAALTRTDDGHGHATVTGGGGAELSTRTPSGDRLSLGGELALEEGGLEGRGRVAFQRGPVTVDLTVSAGPAPEGREGPNVRGVLGVTIRH